MPVEKKQEETESPKKGKKIALRPFSFERTGGPPPSVILNHSKSDIFFVLFLFIGGFGKEYGIITKENGKSYAGNQVLKIVNDCRMASQNMLFINRFCFR
jgi:hypothetical protein